MKSQAFVELIDNKSVYFDRENFLLCVFVGLGVHILSTWAVTNRPLKYVSEGMQVSYKII